MSVKLVVMGVSGCGKTTAAKAIARALAAQCEALMHWLSTIVCVVPPYQDRM